MRSSENICDFLEFKQAPTENSPKFITALIKKYSRGNALKQVLLLLYFFYFLGSAGTRILHHYYQYSGYSIPVSFDNLPIFSSILCFVPSLSPGLVKASRNDL